VIRKSFYRLSMLTILASTSLDSSLILEEGKTHLSFPSKICVTRNEAAHSMPTAAKAARKAPGPLPNAAYDMVIGTAIGRLPSVPE
jgi:hypothetical protein